MKAFLKLFPVLAMTGLMAACDSRPEVGSDAWCDDLEKKPKSGWTLDDTGNYARFCVLGVGEVVGSKSWCEGMKAKPKGDWSGNEAADYARHCVF